MRNKNKLTIFWLLAISCGLMLFSAEARAQTPKEITITVADNKYGAGGTIETTSDEKLKLVKEVWKDTDGNVKELHSISYSDAKNPNSATLEQWYFYKNRDKVVAGFSLILEEDPSTGIPHWVFHGGSMTDQTAPMVDLDDIKVPKAHELIGEIEKQFADDGTIQKISNDTGNLEQKSEKSVDTKVEPPKLPVKEVFNQDENKKTKTSTAPQPSNEEPKRVPHQAGESSSGFKTDIKKPSGLNTIIFTTPKNNRIEIYFPDALYAGLGFSATMRLFPVSNTSDRDELKNYALKVGGQVFQIADGLFTLTLDSDTKDTTCFLTDKKGKEKTGVSLPVSLTPPSAPRDACLPKSGTSGGLIAINGPFQGGVTATDYLRIGGQDMTILSKMANEIVAFDTNETPGSTDLELGTNGSVFRGRFSNLKVVVTADKLNLLKGEKTTVHILVSGLQGITKPANMSITSSGPISLAGGGSQSLAISPSQAATNGTFSMELALSAIEKGSFGVAVTVTLDEPPCKQPE